LRQVPNLKKAKYKHTLGQKLEMENAINRPCPECKQAGILVEDLYPHGTQCQFCAKHIEVDSLFGILSIACLAVLTMLNFSYWDLSFVGVITASLLIINALIYQTINARFMPLKHYDDETSL
jgi:hypothetical protein